MSRDVEQLLRTTADAPTRPLDATVVVARARRQTLLLRAGFGGVGVAVVAAAFLLVLPLVGAGGPGIEVADQPDTDEDSGQASAEDLAGRTFVSVEIIEDGSRRELVEGTELTVAFERPFSPAPLEGEEPTHDVDADRWLAWDAGCNHHRSAVMLNEGVVELVGPDSMTSIGCPEDKGEQDRWLANFFDANPAWELEDDRLTLIANSTVIVLEEQQDAGRPEGGLGEPQGADEPDRERPQEDGQARSPDYEAHPVDDADAERAIELIRDPEHRRHVSQRMGPGDVHGRLEGMLDDYDAELEGTLAGTAMSPGPRQRPDVIVIERFTSGDDYQWGLPLSCPAYLEDPELTGIAWHVDLEAEELLRVSPVFEANIC